MTTLSLIKYIYTHATDEVIRRGKIIYTKHNITLIEHNTLLQFITFKVKDDIYATQYTVNIHKFADLKSIYLKCSCKYNVGRMCRHKAGALFYLQTMLNQKKIDQPIVAYNQARTIVEIPTFNIKNIQLFCSSKTYTEAEQFLRLHKANVTFPKNQVIAATISINKEVFETAIQKTNNNRFYTHCNCKSECKHPLCLHKTILLLQLLHTNKVSYFNEKTETPSIINEEENKEVISTSTLTIEALLEQQRASQNQIISSQKKAYSSTVKLGLVINLNYNSYPFFRIDAVQGETNEEATKFIGKVERIDFGKTINTNILDNQDKVLLQQLRKLQPTEVHKFIDRKSVFAGFWENVKHHNNEELPTETQMLIAEYMHPKIKHLFSSLHHKALAYYLPKQKTFITQHLQNIYCISKAISPQFKIIATTNGYTVSGIIKIEDIEIPLKNNEMASPFLFKYNNHVYTWAYIKDIETTKPFTSSDSWFIETDQWPQVLQEKILPLTQQYIVDFGDITQKIVTNNTPVPHIELQESGEYILFKPTFTYNNHIAPHTNTQNIIIAQNHTIQIIERDLATEHSFLKRFQSLHAEFVRTENATYLLKGNELLKHNWLYTFVEKMEQEKIAVVGWQSLKKFRFNTKKPTTQIRIKNNNDWFDLNVHISFGDQQVDIVQIKKALAQQQTHIQLNDGSLGILDDEWLKKYALLFKVGEIENKQLALKKYHSNIVDELYENKNEIEQQIQFSEKIQRLKINDRNYNIDPPKTIQHTLRPYQLEGFKWFVHLYNIGWGGILADDMGLGKTVQTLSFLLYLKEIQKTLSVLIVSPTTLLYNWENEIKKFTPQLSYSIHHGNQRSATIEKNRTDIMLTTYGTIRSDVQLFKHFLFDYIVLDESQFIKNTASKTTKAVMLLQAKNKICLSGTPLQNNTFDVYAQMHFLNLGLLGSIEHFKQSFTIPIDKLSDEIAKEQLRKLLQPFILRRTKEQVATDLPQKTETILYCEMGLEQHRIYEMYRQLYQHKILGLVEEQGVQKSQLTILQGLMKLRQICNSPAILNNEPERFNNYSVKLEELTRELSENIGNHKVLIFSQFLGMLSLIKDQLIKMNIPFVSFDGKTSAVERESAVQQFQQNEVCRVFLISLKAGGVGLNLTAADYVYIIDPWWNPAVEQQAIDRTHRIGQNKNVFAYRMICKNTIEDKILKLQERKQLLAKELISEAGFVSSLSKEDIEYLFEKQLN